MGQLKTKLAKVSSDFGPKAFVVVTDIRPWRKPQPRPRKPLPGPGQTLVVYKIHRLARSPKDLLSLLERLRLAGCALKSLTEPVDTSSAMGELVLQILGAVAQFERSIIRERCMAGKVAAREKGQSFARPRDLSPEEEIEVYRLYALG
ncbi:recombinase family protein [Variovorax sp. M-6]|uniref:recombinase family protein n=1 Tax=Variovorax sp. M-6 TaxID=3233041 RepID=UPI003F99D2D3